MQNKNGQTAKRALLVGAGEGAKLLVGELSRSPLPPFLPVCLADDDPMKWGLVLGGAPVAGTTAQIPALCAQYRAEVILLCMPSVEGADRRRILKSCLETGCRIMSMPNLLGLLQERGDLLGSIRQLGIEELLGRPAARPAFGRSAGCVRGKTVLVTGGGGSIGSELCRQLALLGPKRLILLDIYENNAYQVQQELLRRHGGALPLKVVIASVRDYARLEGIFRSQRPQIVFHAAAHKHVPLMEDCPCEAVKNNVGGTLNAARLARLYGAERFLLVSTDKAVHPANVMGATKRLCEMVIQAMGSGGTTVFSAVRFGNVLGSNGSVIPLFEEQIAAGGPVTVTDPDMVRYFMTIPEAVTLLLEAGSMAKNGEIFILDMGQPVRILDLARRMIRLAGFRPEIDIPIRIIGLRPGEKLREQLLLEGERMEPTGCDRVYRASPLRVDPALPERIARLLAAAEQNDETRCRALLREAVAQAEAVQAAAPVPAPCR